MPPSIHPGGLRYHSDNAIVSQLYNEGLIEALAVPQVATFEAGVQFARAEGIVPAPESCHAIRACIDEALHCKQTGEAKTLFFNLSGHGHFDMASYDKYFAGDLRLSGRGDPSGARSPAQGGITARFIERFLRKDAEESGS